MARKNTEENAGLGGYLVILLIAGLLLATLVGCSAMTPEEREYARVDRDNKCQAFADQCRAAGGQINSLGDGSNTRCSRWRSPVMYCPKLAP